MSSDNMRHSELRPVIFARAIDTVVVRLEMLVVGDLYEPVFSIYNSIGVLVGAWPLDCNVR